MLLGSYVIPLIDIFADIKDQIANASIRFPNPLKPLSQTESPPLPHSRVPLSTHYDVEYSSDEGSSIAGNSSVFSPAWTISTGTRASVAPSSAYTGSEVTGRVNFPF
jgi:hypothetical protein